MTATPIEPARAASIRTFSSSAAAVEEPVEAGDQIAYDYAITDADGKVIDVRTVTFNPPDTNVLVMMLARLEASTNLELAGTTVNMFMSMVADDDDVRYFNRRLFNPKDSFSSADIAETLAAIVEDWGDRPTEPAPASSASHSGRGKKSRAKQHGHRSGHGNGRSASGSPSSTRTSDGS